MKTANKLSLVFMAILAVAGGLFLALDDSPKAIGQSFLACFPEKANIAVGEAVRINATGGNGNYIWSAPELIINNPFGSSFVANFATPGIKTITVRSASLQANCFVTVNQASSYQQPYQIQPYDSTPYFPSTGGGGARFFR